MEKLRPLLRGQAGAKGSESFGASALVSARSGSQESSHAKLGAHRNCNGLKARRSGHHVTVVCGNFQPTFCSLSETCTRQEFQEA